MVNADVVDMVAIIMRVIISSIVIIAEGGVGEDIISDLGERLKGRGGGRGTIPIFQFLRRPYLYRVH